MKHGHPVHPLAPLLVHAGKLSAPGRSVNQPNVLPTSRPKSLRSCEKGSPLVYSAAADRNQFGPGTEVPPDFFRTPERVLGHVRKKLRLAPCPVTSVTAPISELKKSESCDGDHSDRADIGKYPHRCRRHLIPEPDGERDAKP